MEPLPALTLIEQSKVLQPGNHVHRRRFGKVPAQLTGNGLHGLRPFALFLSLIKENQHEDDNEYEEEKDGREDGKEFHV